MAQWNENLILVDADHLDRVAFDLIVNFERMLGRRIPQADLCHWLDCIALDGGLREGDNSVQAVFIHAKEKGELQHFTPSHFDEALNGKAFKDNLGEFTLLSFPVESVVSSADFFLQSLEVALEAKETKRIMIVGDFDEYGERLKQVVGKAENKDVTIFAMQPISGYGFKSEILGYSLMSAMGIRGDEFR